MSHICHHCIGETVLKTEMRTTGDEAECDWCRRLARGFSGERLATRVEPVYRMMVGPADEGHRFVGGRSFWGPTGRPPVELMTELVEADDDGIAREVLGVLAARYRWDAHEGGLDLFDEQSEDWDFGSPSNTQMRDAWVAFCEALRTKSRFFADHSALDAILQPVLSLPLTRKAMQTITPGGPLSTIYRGRIANDEPAQAEIYASPLSRLGAPPAGTAGAGRMNAAGISVFYGAFDANTCLAELRVPVGGAAIVGRFEVTRPLRVLDLSRLESIGERVSPFEADYVERLSFQSFLRGFHEEIKRAVIPGREVLDYLPTQAVAEYLWTKTDPPLDGVIFGSAQISGRHKNVVLFPHASVVDGAADEVTRTVRSIYEDGPREDDENRPLAVRVRLAPVRDTPAEEQPSVSGAEDWFSEFLDADAPRPGAVPAALRLAGLQLLKVGAIRYASSSAAIEIEEFEDDPRL